MKTEKIIIVRVTELTSTITHVYSKFDAVKAIKNKGKWV